MAGRVIHVLRTGNLEHPSSGRSRYAKVDRLNGKSHIKYRIHGLVFESEIKLPDLTPAPLSVLCDATISFGDIPGNLPAYVEQGARYQIAPSDFLIWMDRVARFRVAGGNQITVAPDPNANMDDVAELLLSIPLGILLLQRGAIVLSASVVTTTNGAFMIVGRSISGKSTLAAWFALHGARVISDDISAVTFDADEMPYVEPGPTRVRLLPEPASKTLNIETPRSVASGLFQKRSFEFKEKHCIERVVLKKIYVIEVSVDPQCKAERPPSKRDRTQMLKRFIYGRQFLHALETGVRYERQVQRLAVNVPMAIFTRPKSVNTVAELGMMILNDFSK